MIWMKEFQNWAAEYRREADALNDRVKALRSRLKKTYGRENCELKRRIAMLYTMYLECREVAIVLEHHPASRWDGETPRMEIDPKQENDQKEQAASWERTNAPDGLLFFERGKTTARRRERHGA